MVSSFSFLNGLQYSLGINCVLSTTFVDKIFVQLHEIPILKTVISSCPFMSLFILIKALTTSHYGFQGKKSLNEVVFRFFFLFCRLVRTFCFLFPLSLSNLQCSSEVLWALKIFMYKVLIGNPLPFMQ